MRVAVMALGLLLLAPLVRAEADHPASAASPAPAPAGLKLGPYGSVHADDPLTVVDVPRFQEHVEVHGKAMDSKYLTMRLEWWLKDFDPTRGPTPATMSAPSIREMHDYRPHPPDAVDLVPVMQWLADKLGKKNDH